VRSAKEPETSFHATQTTLHPSPEKLENFHEMFCVPVKRKSYPNPPVELSLCFAVPVPEILAQSIESVLTTCAVHPQELRDSYSSHDDRVWQRVQAVEVNETEM